MRIAPSVARRMKDVRRRAVSSGLPCLVISIPRLTALVWKLDWSCEYVHAVAGELVAAQNKEISHLTTVLHGRLRGVQSSATPSSEPQPY